MRPVVLCCVWQTLADLVDRRTCKDKGHGKEKEKEKNMKYILAAVALLAITGCNTIQGIGQDIEAVGSGLEEAAD